LKRVRRACKCKQTQHEQRWQVDFHQSPPALN
jgi:hypothetical protein